MLPDKINRFLFSSATTHLFSTIVLVVFVTMEVFAENRRADEVNAPRRENAFRVSVRITDTQGTPIKDAQVLVITSESSRSARINGVNLTGGFPTEFHTVGQVRTDRDGKCEFAIPDSRTGFYHNMFLCAAATGHGHVIKAIGAIPPDESIDVELVPEKVIRGRCIDLNGQPAAGVRVQIVRQFGLHGLYWPGWQTATGALDVWRPVTTDDMGRFIIRGLGNERVALRIDGDNFTPQEQQIDPSLIDDDTTESISLTAAKYLTGRVTLADSNEPVANAKIVIPAGLLGESRWVETVTDSEGRFTAKPYALDQRTSSGNRNKYIVNVFPPMEIGYPMKQEMVPITRAVKQDIEIKLHRGAKVSGRITEGASEVPVAGARVQFVPRMYRHTAQIEGAYLDTVVTDGDGRYELPVPREEGHLFVVGPTVDFVRMSTSHQEIDLPHHKSPNDELLMKTPGRTRLYADAILPCDFKSAEGTQNIDVRLRRGVTLRGRAFDSSGRPVPKFQLVSPQYLVGGYEFHGNGACLCRNGEFELRGCDPEKTYSAYLYDESTDCGTAVELTKRNEREPAVVRFEPCGSAEGRLISADGKPAAGVQRPFHSCLLTEGAPTQRVYGLSGLYPLEADIAWALGSEKSEEQDPEKYRHSARDGRVIFPVLIPGAKYMINWYPNDSAAPEPYPHLIITVKPGEKKDLGDIVVRDTN